jgi:DNA gyrase/topoisomerase IV subunit A
MKYAMKTIIDRALPDVRDGLKPVHRRVIFKLKTMGLTSDAERGKCGTVVGEVLKIHGHGDMAVYETLARLTEQQEGQLHP